MKQSSNNKWEKKNFKVSTVMGDNYVYTNFIKREVLVSVHFPLLHGERVKATVLSYTLVKKKKKKKKFFSGGVMTGLFCYKAEHEKGQEIVPFKKTIFYSRVLQKYYSLSFSFNLWKGSIKLVGLVWTSVREAWLRQVL